MKTALVLEGQGLAGAFTCGVLYRFLEAGLVPDGLVAASQAVLPAVYFRCGQKEALEALYDRALPQEEARNLDLIPRRADLEKSLARMTDDLPVDMEAWQAADLPLYGLYTRADNGDATAISLDAQTDWRRLRQFIAAATARPGQSQPIMLDDRAYFDAALSRPLPVEAALEAGFESLIAVRTLPRDREVRRKLLSPRERLALQHFPAARNAWQLAHLYVHAAEKTLADLEAQGRALVLRPSRENHHTYGYGHSAAADYYMQGLEAADRSLDRAARLLQA